MGTKNFKVDTGIEVGNITLTAATGNVAIPVASQLTLGNVILRDNGDGKLRARNITDDADVEIVATLAATSTTQGNIQIGTNHIESTNVNGPISIRPNGTGVVGLFSNTIALGRGGDVTIATGVDLPDVYQVDFVAGNIVLAPGSNKLTLINANTIISGNASTTSATSGALVVTGGIATGGNLWVGGNLTVEGSTTTINSTTLNVSDAMVYLGSGNNADVLDIGLVASFNPGTAQFGGLVRDASDSVWKLFSGVTTQPGTTVDFTSASYANLQVGNLTASQGFVGINTATPRARLHVNGGAGEGAIIFGSGTISYPTAPTQLNGLVSKGATSDGRLMIQDGNGRLNDYWNAYSDAGGLKYIVSGEAAARRLMSVSSTTGGQHVFYGAPAGTAGGSISWTSIGSLTSGTGGSVWFSPRGTSSDFLIGDSGNISTAGTFTISNTTAATSTTTGAFTVSGGVGVAGNLHIGGTTPTSSQTTGALVVAGGVGVGEDIYAFGAIKAGNETHLNFADPLFVGTKSSNSYVQVAIQNKSTGASSSTDFVATTSDGTDSANYIDMGINGQNYSSASWTISGARDGYLYVNGGDLTLGTDTAATTVSVHVGGTLAACVVATFNPAGTVSSSTSTGVLVVNGGLGVSAASNLAATAITSLGVGTAATGTSGEIRATNNITAYFSSDARLKENVQDIPNALDAVVSIGGKLFDWRDDYLAKHGGEDSYFVRKQDFGVIAQDVQTAFPRAVRTREDGTLAVDYEKLCALAFAAIKELSEKIKILESK